MYDRFIKRTIDVVLSGIALLVLSPVYLILAILVRIKLGSPVMSVSKIIKFAQALVSMLFLETAMFSQFGGEMAPEHQRLMIMLTGGGIAAIVVVMAVYVIVRSTTEIQKMKQTD